MNANMYKVGVIMQLNKSSHNLSFEIDQIGQFHLIYHQISPYFHYSIVLFKNYK
jgi:hypothetical protein